MKNENGADPQNSRQEQLNLLREQGFSEAEANALANWQAPVPTPAETAALVQQLRPHVRIRSTATPRAWHGTNLWQELLALLALARTQMSILHPSFWLASAAVTLLGCYLMVSLSDTGKTLLLLAIGPFLSYLGCASAFRGFGLGTLEFELACPPTPRQLTLARLAIVLAYNCALGLIFSVVTQEFGNGFWTFMLHWLAPMLLVVGVTLLVSLRMAFERAAILVYAAWLSLIGVVWWWNDPLMLNVLATPHGEIALGLVGVGALGFALRHISNATARAFPYSV